MVTQVSFVYTHTLSLQPSPLSIPIYSVNMEQEKPLSSAETLSSASFPVSFINVPQNEIEVPEYLSSIRTYELIGFNHDVAYDMWSRYITGY